MVWFSLTGKQLCGGWEWGTATAEKQTETAEETTESITETAPPSLHLLWSLSNTEWSPCAAPKMYILLCAYVRLHVRVHSHESECVCVHVSVCVLMLYALNFDNYYVSVKNV